MKNNRYIGPVAVAVVMVAYFALYMAISATVPGLPVVVRAVATLLPAVFIVLMIKTLLDRIKEIKKGEDNDLGKY